MSTALFDLDGRIAIVTGASRGIGAATAHLLAEQGAHVVLASRKLEELEKVRDEITAAGGKASAIAAHGGISDDLQRLLAETVRQHGRLDILVNNAGVNTFANRVTIDAFPLEEWHRVTAIDLDGLFLMSRAALAPMLAAGQGGRIVNIASVVGLAAMRLQSAFVAAKAGVVHLTRSMALELGPCNVLVNAIAPGSIMTEGTRKLFYGADGTFAGRTAEFMEHIPLRRPGTPEEIGEAVLFFVSPAAAYVTGQVLAVDGGWTAGFSI